RAFHVTGVQTCALPIWPGWFGFDGAAVEAEPSGPRLGRLGDRDLLDDLAGLAVEQRDHGGAERDVGPRRPHVAIEPCAGTGIGKAGCPRDRTIVAVRDLGTPHNALLLARRPYVAGPVAGLDAGRAVDLDAVVDVGADHGHAAEAVGDGDIAPVVDRGPRRAAGAVGPHDVATELDARHRVDLGHGALARVGDPDVA